MSRLASRPWRSLVPGVLLAGTFDLCFASTFWWFKAGVTPMRVGHSVAAGLLGKEAARAGGWSTALLGYAAHYAIIFAMFGIYCLVARRAPALVRQWLPCGTLYGVWLWVAMNYIVVPLSAAHGAWPTEFSLWVGLSIVVHAIIGIACAWFARRALATR